VGFSIWAAWLTFTSIPENPRAPSFLGVGIAFIVALALAAALALALALAFTLALQFRAFV
jgi:hypothetical protein